MYSRSVSLAKPASRPGSPGAGDDATRKHGERSLLSWALTVGAFDGLPLTSGNEQNEDTSSSVSGWRGCVTSIGRGSQLPDWLAGAVAGSTAGSLPPMSPGVRRGPEKCPHRGRHRTEELKCSRCAWGRRWGAGARCARRASGLGAPAASWGSAHSGAVTLWLHIVKVFLKSFRCAPKLPQQWDRGLAAAQGCLGAGLWGPPAQQLPPLHQALLPRAKFPSPGWPGPGG